MKINALAFALAALAGSASARLEVKSKLSGLNDADEHTSKIRGGNFALVKSQTGLNGGGDPELHRAVGRHTSFGTLQAGSIAMLLNCERAKVRTARHTARSCPPCRRPHATRSRKPPFRRVVVCSGL
jgi:hypothetical protein